MADKFDEMNKGQLRAACKEAGISYSGLNNDGMRDALRAKQGDGFEATEEELSKQTGRKQPEQEEELRPDPVTDASTGVTDIAPAPHKPAPRKRQPAKAKQGDRHTGTGLKIEKDREKKNGVTRPSAGGRCRAVWDALDEYRELEGVLPDAAFVKKLAQENDWNVNNASIEFYQWRKFHGIKGRTAAAKK